MALLEGEGTLRVEHAYEDAINEELGPFDIGLGGRGSGGN